MGLLKKLLNKEIIGTVENTNEKIRKERRNKGIQYFCEHSINDVEGKKYTLKENLGFDKDGKTSLVLPTIPQLKKNKKYRFYVNKKDEIVSHEEYRD